MARSTKTKKTETDRFFQNPRQITEKFSAFDNAFTNGNVSMGVVSAGKLGYRVGVTAAQRSTNMTTGDLKYIIETLTGQPIPKGSLAEELIEAVNERNNG